MAAVRQNVEAEAGSLEVEAGHVEKATDGAHKRHLLES